MYNSRGYTYCEACTERWSTILLCTLTTQKSIILLVICSLRSKCDAMYGMVFKHRSRSSSLPGINKKYASCRTYF